MRCVMCVLMKESFYVLLLTRYTQLSFILNENTFLLIVLVKPVTPYLGCHFNLSFNASDISVNLVLYFVLRGIDAMMVRSTVNE